MEDAVLITDTSTRKTYLLVGSVLIEVTGHADNRSVPTMEVDAAGYAAIAAGLAP